MRVAVTGAGGLIGSALVPALRSQGHDVVRLVRREPVSDDEIRWDPASGRLDPRMLAGVDAAVHLSGAGVGDRRWSPAYKQTIRASRIDSTRTLAGALAHVVPRPAVLVCGSAVGYYGDRGEETLTEDSSPGHTFLAEVTCGWEAATAPAAQAGVRVVHARTGLVLSGTGGALGRLATLTRAGLAGPLGSGRQWWSWISRADEVGALVHLLTADLSGPVNLTAPNPVRHRELVTELARLLHRPSLVPAPAFALRLALGEFAGELLASQRVLPRRLLASGYRYRHPDLRAALAWALADDGHRLPT